MTIYVDRIQSKLFALSLALLSILTSFAHAQLPAVSGSPPRSLTVSGSATLSPLVSDIARRFEGLNPGVKIEVRPVGSGKGIADVRTGVADIGLLSRALFKHERDLFAYPIARDGVAVIVHRDNPVRGLSTQQLIDLLTGQLHNWKTVGGRDAPVNLAWRRGHGSFELMLDRLNLRRDQIVGHVMTGSIDNDIRFAATTPNGVTLGSVGDSERRIRDGAPIKLLAYNGMPASSRSIQSHGYALSRPLTLITRQFPRGLQKQFIDYALSSQVVDLQLTYGFVPYKE